MKICKKCGAEADDTDNFCSYCAAKFDQKNEIEQKLEELNQNTRAATAMSFWVFIFHLIYIFGNFIRMIVDCFIDY